MHVKDEMEKKEKKKHRRNTERASNFDKWRLETSICQENGERGKPRTHCLEGDAGTGGGLGEDHGEGAAGKRFERAVGAQALPHLRRPLQQRAYAPPRPVINVQEMLARRPRRACCPPRPFRGCSDLRHFPLESEKN